MRKIYEFDHYNFFSEMSELALKHNSFDLSLGVPDYEIDPQLRYYLKESADVLTHSYEPLAGNPLLIESIVKFNFKRKNSLPVKNEEVNVVPCSTFALYTSLKSVLNQGDEVIVIEPSYYTYVPSIILNGGIPVYCDVDNDFKINWEKLQNCISEKTRAIIVNSPQNPTGKIWTESDWNQLYDLIKDQEIYLISEEIYDVYCYDGVEHYSSFHHPELRKRTFCIFSFGKMFHATGWKVSYLLASKELLENFRAHQQYISFSTNSPAQYAIAQYLTIFDTVESKKIMENKRNLFCELVKNTPLIIENCSEGAFYQVVNFRNISKKMSDVEFSKWLTIDKKVSCLPLSAFYNSKKNSDYIRFSFAKKDEVIIQALEHLRKVL
ncbi:aminotransferase class I/II-fold pyridoxal phosphate-dependent enzyme [Chryseobacterium oryctis]|uniref:Aminotransferase class I/II-fold pyridoxal phosphate-dependent enzyme n=1 Tax=Chryseobacterium oryctis TaxID=2952618 RepID=A0ABT3HR32_9FLAO|nr:aminotransferase class I/II-fold pyridoxal phosphate-dependent enzyme [Chryseobacterium oryctis]MCW3162246.1 aminotransferase class I/II-fold pyridoxal phosphate-dependent enzyme [Chryseobacterium oryctis]